MTEIRMVGEPTSARLYLVSETGPAAAQRLAAALEAGDVATVLLVPPAGKTLEPAPAKELVELVQKAGVAALVADDARLARTLKADGVHLFAAPGTAERYAEAREILGTRYIVGADAGRSRHDAMTIGEAGADYVAFTLPENASVEDEDEQLEQLAWWSEIFEVPCVAFGARAPEEAEAQAAAGADFVAVPIATAATLADVQSEIAAYADALAQAQRPADAGH
jgi:thiamine-phosphate pyrophosphorylase